MLFAVIIVLAGAPFVGDDPTWVHLGTLVGLWSLFGISFNLIWGYAGQFSMGQIGLGAVSSYVTALLFLEAGWSFWPGMLMGVAAAVVTSAILGVLTLRLQGFYFAIMTLAFVLIFLAFISNLAVAGRTTGLNVTYDLGRIAIGGLSWDLGSRQGGFYALLVVAVLLCLFFLSRLERTRFGRGLVAIREDELLATSLGIATARYKILAFMLSAVIAGLAGAFHGHYFRFVAPALYGFHQLITLIVMVVIGGTGRRLGPIIGAGLYIGLVEGLRFGGDFRAGLFGVVLIAVVLFAPDGVLGVTRRLRLRVTGRGRLSEASAVLPDPDRPGGDRPTSDVPSGSARGE
ncbi:MAG: branched-chain amino acid ABC transporter permease [Actinobacteria bacterium]|nr:branched-chain amino acid ABC transporter permease [Actinomycetota bacterium]